VNIGESAWLWRRGVRADAPQCGRSGRTGSTRRRSTASCTPRRPTASRAPCLCPPAAVLTYPRSVPFFYEPAFAARVAPLPAALRLQTAKERAAAEGRYAPVTYGEFLLKKVGANFDLSGGKEATPAARY
jgi:hypothetical protein